MSVPMSRPLSDSDEYARAIAGAVLLFLYRLELMQATTLMSTTTRLCRA
jgi:hypothetical protein